LGPGGQARSGCTAKSLPRPSRRWPAVAPPCPAGRRAADWRVAAVRSAPATPNVPGPPAVPAGTWAERMITMSSSYEPTSATAGHTATTAPDGLLPRPRATLAASVAAIPRPSGHRASGGTGAFRRRVEHHHGAGVDQPVHRQWRQPTRPLRLAVRPDQGIGRLVGHNRSDSRDTDYRPRRRPSNDPIGRCHRAPPTAKVLVSAISLLCPIGRPWSSDTHNKPLTCGYAVGCVS